MPDDLLAVPVSSYVGNPRNKESRCIEPVGKPVRLAVGVACRPWTGSCFELEGDAMRFLNRFFFVGMLAGAALAVGVPLLGFGVFVTDHGQRVGQAAAGSGLAAVVVSERGWARLVVAGYWDGRAHGRRGGTRPRCAVRQQLGDMVRPVHTRDAGHRGTGRSFPRRRRGVRDRLRRAVRGGAGLRRGQGLGASDLRDRGTTSRCSKPGRFRPRSSSTTTGGSSTRTSAALRGTTRRRRTSSIRLLVEPA